MVRAAVEPLSNNRVHSMNRRRLLYTSLAVLLAFPLLAQDKPSPPPLSPEEILKKVTYPSEFEASVFASPPNISYPIFLSASSDGTLFVACDENGSLDRKPGRGRVVMCQDTDGDGCADKFTDFARM